MHRRIFATGMFSQKPYWQRLVNMLGKSFIIGYWPFWEKAGTTATEIVNARNGTYAAAGITYGQPGVGDRKTSVLLDGDGAHYIVIGHAAVLSAFSWAAGSFMIWAKVSVVGDWTDGVRRHLFHTNFDANNYIRFSKEINNIITCDVKFGGDEKTLRFTTTSVDWIPFVVTWDKAADNLYLYAAGALVDQAHSLGTGTGTPGGMRVGSSTGSSGGWKGNLAHAILLNKAVTP